MRPDRGRPGPEAVCPLLWQAAWERASLGSEVLVWQPQRPGEERVRGACRLRWLAAHKLRSRAKQRTGMSCHCRAWMETLSMMDWPQTTTGVWTMGQDVPRAGAGQPQDMLLRGSKPLLGPGSLIFLPRSLNNFGLSFLAPTQPFHWSLI